MTYSHREENEHGDPCFVFRERSGRITRICVTPSMEGDPPNAERGWVNGRTTCIDEFGNQIICAAPTDEEIRECREKYGINDYFRDP